MKMAGHTKGEEVLIRRVVYLCKVITLCDVVCEAIHLQIHTNVEVFPQVILSMVILWYFLPFEPLSVFEPGVFLFGLHNGHSVVLQVIIDDHWTHTVFFRGIQEFLFKECLEAQHLKKKQAGDRPCGELFGNN